MFSPCAARAVGIGDITLLSRFGEPLLAQVELLTPDGENIDASCLSLVAPDAGDEEARNYLLGARLEIRTAGAKQYVLVSSRKTLDDLFVKLRLRVKCPGTGGIVKTLTVLPDLGEAPVPAVSVAEESAAPAKPSAATRETPKEETQQIAPSPAARPAAKKPAPKPAPARQPAPPAHRETAAQPEFRLKLSSAPIDASRIGKISPEEREQLLAQQKLLDADDETARFLALQHQVKELQDELGDIKLRLAQLGGMPPGSASAVPASSPLPVAAKPPQPAAQPRIVVKDEPLPLGMLAAVALALLAVAAVLFLLRRHTRIKAHRAALPVSAQDVAEPLPAAAAPAATTAAPPVPPPVEPPHTETLRMEMPGPQPAAVPERLPQEEPNREDAMLEEAELYSLHGHTRKALEILDELVAQHPEHAKARMRQLSILSSLGMAQEFEQSAQAFLRLGPDDEAWKVVQALGRTLAPDSPLYAGAEETPAARADAARHRLIGEILVDMGALSVQDLENCLADFDPAAHGRLGGYLIARKAISFDQLNQALLKQQQEDRSLPPPEPEPLAAPEPKNDDRHKPLEFEPVSADAFPLELNFLPAAAPAAPAPETHEEKTDDAPVPLFLKLDLDLDLPDPKTDGKQPG